jgi:hypothetical protein
VIFWKDYKKLLLIRDFVPEEKQKAKCRRKLKVNDEIVTKLGTTLTKMPLLK